MRVRDKYLVSKLAIEYELKYLLISHNNYYYKIHFSKIRKESSKKRESYDFTKSDALRNYLVNLQLLKNR